MDTLLDQLRRALKDRYRVDEEIGRGGMATVFRAQDLRYDRPVAIKVLSPDITSVISAERFSREIRISARLSHPNILTVFDSGEVGQLLFYVMTHVNGESLRARMKRETYLPIEDAIRITCEVADALGYAHSEGVIHRDIKPENILLRGGHVLVADFGIARLSVSEGESLTAVGTSVGTAAYMSPEQTAGDTVDARTDIYSLGCTLYEMLAGQLPFTGPNPMAIAARRMLDPIPSIRSVRPAVSEHIEAVVMRSMERVAADRFHTMDEFKGALVDVVRTTSVPAARPTETRKASSHMRRRRLVTGAGVASLLVAIAVTGARFFSERSPSLPPDVNRVAVLYFDDASNGPLRYLADGLTESLIDRLAAAPALDVISRNGVRSFRGRVTSSDSVALFLQVGTIVRGRVEFEDRKLRLTVLLVDAASDVEISRRTFDLDTAQIVLWESRIAADVVDLLRDRFGGEVRLRDERVTTANSQAWRLVQHAGTLAKDADSLRAAGANDAALKAVGRADSLLAVAQRLDGKWARVPVSRAMAMHARATQLNNQLSFVAEAIDNGLAHAEQALSLEPNNPDALEIKGRLQYFRYAKRIDADSRRIERLLPEAESNLRQAVERNKDQAGAWAALSALYLAKRDVGAANNAALNAFRADEYLSSADLMKRLFWTSHDLEKFAEALKWCNEGRRRFPADPDFTKCRLFWMYTTRLETPDVDSAWVYRDRYVMLTPEKNRPYAQKMGDVLVAGTLARAGLRDSARQVLLRARATLAEDPHRDLEGTEALIRVILGDDDEAVRLLTDYLKINPSHRRQFATATGWWWRDLQANPKYKAMIAEPR